MPRYVEHARRIAEKLRAVPNVEVTPDPPHTNMMHLYLRVDEKALKAYQQQHGLKVDGSAGPDTFAQMRLFELILLKPGTSGDTVKKLQQSLGIAADGQFGAGTQKAVREFQSKNGLEADGLAGPATLAKMSLFKEMTADVVKKSEVPAGAAPAATKAAPSGTAPAR